MKDPYLYYDSEVLRNKLNLKKEFLLNNAEADIVPIKLAKLDDVISNRNFDFNHLKEIHKYLFEDIYEFAGKPRVINIEKAEKTLNGLSVEYAGHKEIEKEAKAFFKEFRSLEWNNLNLDEKAELLTKTTAKLWKLHPFREGNTRTTIAFITQYTEEKGFKLDKKLLSENGKYVRNSLVLASIGEYSEYEHLKKILKDSIERGEKNMKVDEHLNVNAKEFNITDENIGKYEVYETTRDIRLEDETFIKKGTEFRQEGFKDGKYNLHFPQEPFNKYTNETAEYKFSLSELKEFSIPTKDSIESVFLKGVRDRIYDNIKNEEDLDYMIDKYGSLDNFTKEYIELAKSDISKEHQIEHIEVNPSAVAIGEISVVDVNEFIAAERELDSYKSRLMEEKMQELEERHLKGDFNIKHLQRINAYITEDQGTHVNISGKNIEKLNAEVFKPLKEQKYLKGMDAEGISEKLAEYYMKIDETKPFMDGNIGTTKVFIKELAAKNGFDLKWNKAENMDNPFNGIKQLAEIIKKCFISIEPSKDLMKSIDKGMDRMR